ncbi:Com family DNA-binding transcriptional regulator [Vandammella animalimorsus]|uniref:Com family DNA-binding transcriptional regulator n=1 Tax=Vandammella animalimorsus TaxID=2029117 RepID=A0A2A2ANT1_9BURK|nr:Com family DNA-binding transcriptional regulator [Vandammella animalimorsus]PAT40255.1 Com family DNA-binding transcriptional regulator [Vandammella animalimorsus]RRD67050.1 Com family DNA-binding transcriptional regulator [Comamonadaceae bacterium OH2310_COT-174]
MQQDQSKQEIRCGQCRKKLGEGYYVCLAIKCQRCKTLNHLRASTPVPHACERPTATREDAHGDINNPIQP